MVGAAARRPRCDRWTFRLRCPSIGQLRPQDKRLISGTRPRQLRRDWTIAATQALLEDVELAIEGDPQVLHLVEAIPQLALIPVHPLQVLPLIVHPFPGLVKRLLDVGVTFGVLLTGQADELIHRLDLTTENTQFPL